MISVGIDVSKGKSVVCILKPGGEIVKPPFEIDHTADELDSLVSLINSFEEETRVVLEDTGHYHLPVVTQHFCLLCKRSANEEVLLSEHSPCQNRQD